MSLENTLTKFIIRNMVTGEAWDFLTSNIKVFDNVKFQYKDPSVTHALSNASYFDSDQTMKPIIIPLTAHVDKANDNAFKRFINTHEKRFALDVTVNGGSYSLLGEIGDQDAEVNDHVKKSYMFDFKVGLMPMQVIQYGGIADETGYDNGTYNNTIYSQGTTQMDDANLSINNDGDINFYVSVEGTTTVGTPVRITINQSTITTINIPSGGGIFKYSNIPGMLDISLNDILRPDLLSPTTGSNFLIPLQQGINVVKTSGLKDTTVKIYKGFKVL